jgi:cell wall-active antibiotic response 4TMS protein YvqF
VQRRDQPNPGALVAGALFIVIGVVFLIDQSLDIDARWIWPILLIGLGVAGLVRSRPREPRDPG